MGHKQAKCAQIQILAVSMVSRVCTSLVGCFSAPAFVFFLMTPQSRLNTHNITTRAMLLDQMMTHAVLHVTPPTLLPPVKTKSPHHVVRMK